MPLEPHEKTIGRWWFHRQVSELAARQAAAPSMVFMPPHIVHFRHECEALGGRNISFEIAEVYVRNPRLALCYGCQEIKPPSAYPECFPHQDDGLGGYIMPEGVIAFVYREGECRRCHMRAGSSRGFIVECATRPPLGREQCVGRVRQ